MLCKNCGVPLQGDDEAALFICPTCELAHEPAQSGLETFLPLTASPTSELAVTGSVQHLAIWRLAVSVEAPPESAWERIRKVAQPGPAHIFVPAFSLLRPLVQRLGVSLVEAQPALELTAGLPESGLQRPPLSAVDLVGARQTASETGMQQGAGDGATPPATPSVPDFGRFSPVVVGRQDARVLAHFVYLAVESHEVHDLHSVDYRLQVTAEDLLFLPAVWDPRYIHESSWRLLLREFDGLVA